MFKARLFWVWILLWELSKFVNLSESWFLSCKMEVISKLHQNYVKSLMQQVSLSSGSIISVQFSRSVVSDFLWPHGLQHARLSGPLPTPRASLNSCPLSWWCRPTISSFVDPSLPAFNLAQHQGLFQWVSSSCQVAKVLELQLQRQSFQYSGLNIQDWFPLGWTGLIFLQSKGLSRVFSNTTVQKHWTSVKSKAG